MRLVLDNKNGSMWACKSISKAKLISPEDVQDVKREVRLRQLCWWCVWCVRAQMGRAGVWRAYLAMAACTAGCCCARRERAAGGRPVQRMLGHRSPALAMLLPLPDRHRQHPQPPQQHPTRWRS